MWLFLLVVLCLCAIILSKATSKGAAASVVLICLCAGCALKVANNLCSDVAIPINCTKSE